MLGNVPAPRDLPTSASATGELAALAPHVERIRAASASAFAPATRRAYGSSWAQFLAWADGEGLQALPAPPAAVAAYLAHRSEDGRSLATLRMDRQAIRAAHIEAGGPDPTASEGVRRVLRGLSRQRAGEGRRQAAALTAEALGAIRATAATPRTGPTGRTESPEAARRRGAVDIALASVMRDAMLRRSEAAALTWADVEFRSDGSGRPSPSPARRPIRKARGPSSTSAGSPRGRYGASGARTRAGRVFGLRSGPFRGSPPGRHGEGRRARGRVLRTLRPRRHGPRPCSARGKRRRRPGRRPLGFLQDARLLRTRRARRPWGRRPVLRGLKRPPARARERGGGSARIRPPRVNQPWRADLLIILASVAAFSRVERSTFSEGGCLCLVRQDRRKRRTGDFPASAARQVPSAWGRGTGNLAAIRRRSRSAGRAGSDSGLECPVHLRGGATRPTSEPRSPRLSARDPGDCRPRIGTPRPPCTPAASG